MFATEIGNVCIIQPHPSVVCCMGIVVKIQHQCAMDLCVSVYERRMSVAKTETGLLPSRLQICVRNG